MKKENKTNHGIAEIMLPDNATEVMKEASLNIIDELDEFGWRSGAEKLSLTCENAEILWTRTLEPKVVIDGIEVDRVRLENAKIKACNVDCFAYRVGCCAYSGDEKIRCKKIKEIYNDHT